MRTHVVRARADVVATKLGIILSSFFSFSMHVLYFQKGFANDLEFLHAFLSKKLGGPPTLLLFKIIGKLLLGEKYVEGKKEERKKKE